ncbi:hypothetical protein H0H93_009940 [Arthromyces matolae]|nr:hypothetical protein H0H93_009940 [Arthromyces matolae]
MHEPRVAFIVDMIDDPKATRKKFDGFEYDDYAKGLATQLFGGEKNAEFLKKTRFMTIVDPMNMA